MFRFELPGVDEILSTEDQIETVKNDVAGLRRQLRDLASVSDWVRFVSDQKHCARRADELTALTVQAIEAKTAAEQAEASLASARAEQEAAQATRDQENRDFYAKGLEKYRDADEKLDLARELYRRMGQMEAQMVRAILSHGNLLSGFNEQLQSLPDLKSALALLGAPKDAHYDDDSAMAVAGAAETVPSPNRIPGSTLTREMPLRTKRRVEA
jgi:hypothetical protein